MSAPHIIPVQFPELPDIEDHVIAGKVTVPAVELIDLALATLAAEAPSAASLALPLVLSDIRFPRFLLGEEIRHCTFELTLESAKQQAAHIELASRITFPSGISRRRVHLEAILGGPPPAPLPVPTDMVFDFELESERTYAELVPFGPRFHNLRSPVRLGRGAALGIVRSPDPPRGHVSVAGCPYLLDSAMHLACVWGQRYLGYVAYPVGIRARVVWLPVDHGERRCLVVPRAVAPERLTCDVWLTDEAGTIADAVTALEMAPMSIGPAPPAWIVDPERARGLV